MVHRFEEFTVVVLFPHVQRGNQIPKHEWINMDYRIKLIHALGRFVISDSCFSQTHAANENQTDVRAHPSPVPATKDMLRLEAYWLEKRHWHRSLHHGQTRLN